MYGESIKNIKEGKLKLKEDIVKLLIDFHNSYGIHIENITGNTHEYRRQQIAEVWIKLERI